MKISTKDYPNLFLLGFMATGKSMIGKAIANKLDMPFIDVDSFIEEKMEMSIPEIFEKYGEAKFRQLEREFVEKEAPEKGAIISCGGGLPCRDDMPELIKTKGISICLFVPVDTILERIQKADNRPLMQVENQRETIENLLEARKEFYLKSDIIISLEQSTRLQCVNYVYRTYIEKVKNL
ncbi:MAG: shikimate kinase [Opitutales bacterium]